MLTMRGIVFMFRKYYYPSLSTNQNTFHRFTSFLFNNISGFEIILGTSLINILTLLINNQVLTSLSPSPALYLSLSLSPPFSFPSVLLPSTISFPSSFLVVFSKHFQCGRIIVLSFPIQTRINNTERKNQDSLKIFGTYFQLESNKNKCVLIDRLNSDCIG